MHVSHDYAVCLLFGLEFKPENVKKAREKVAGYGDLEVCYETSEKNPSLVPIKRMLFDPFTYKRYLEVVPGNSEVGNDLNLCSDTQIVLFINSTFRSDMQAYPDYELRQICAEDIFRVVKSYTNKFEKESDFTQWCKGKVVYTQVPCTRKRNESGNTPRIRELYVLKSEFYENVVKNIVNKLPDFQSHMQNLKKDYILVGYVRKSIKLAQNRVKSIQSMVNNLYSRSSVHKCSVSFSSDASSNIMERDLNDEINTLKELKNVHGNTQNMIDFISSNKNICLVVIDYAGFSTDPVNIQEFIKNNNTIKKIIVDCFPFNCNAIEFERRSILDDTKTLSPFRSRETPRQRSKT